MGSVTAIDHCERIRKELSEYDLAHSRDPIDRRRFEREKEEQAEKAREAERSQREANWWKAIDQRIERHLHFYFLSGDPERPGALTDAIGQAMAENRMEARQEVQHLFKEERKAVDAKLEALEQASNERSAAIDQQIASARESVLQSNSEALGQLRAESREEFKRVVEEKERAVDAKFADLERASNDRSAAIDQQIESAREYVLKSTREVLGQEREERRKEVKGLIEEERRNYEARIAELEERVRTQPARLPIAKAWRSETVTYEGEVVSYQGSAWQARKDTARPPSAGGSDWALIARHGHDAPTLTVRGTFRTDETYAILDIVEYDGSAWIAKSNYPGVPGLDDNWQLISKRGQRGHRGESIKGPQGEKGSKGDKGDSALEIVSWSYDVPNYRATPFAANGTPLPTLDLRPFLQQMLAEVGAALAEQAKQEVLQELRQELNRHPFGL